MQRLIKFSKFRNLGLEKDDYLILNGDFKKGSMGNLILLIGPNNSGKSNVLDGIVKMCTDSNVNSRDITDLYFEEKFRQPSLALVYRDDKYTFELKKELDKSIDFQITEGDVVLDKPSTEVIKKEISEINTIFNSIYGIQVPKLSRLVSNMSSLSDDDLYSGAMTAIRFIFQNYRNGSYNTGYRYFNIWDNLKGRGFELISHFEKDGGSKEPIMKSYLLKQSNIDNLVPKCIVYTEKPIKNSDLSTTDLNGIDNHNFFKALFKSMKVDSKTVLNAYNQFNKSGNIQIIKKLEKDLQKKVDKINTRFNSLYFASSDQYKFSLVCESTKMLFGMARGKEEEAINLEYQSTGFRWFFNLFFNFLSTENLTPGDIVIMDEPATNLHVQGQNELRAFIKQFAIENDVLFVVATHSPFLIDVDHYDELRVISTDNNRSKIDNRFTAINLDDPDSLLPIKESLTIKQNVLYDLDTEVYFVEGITDYNYLTMFKRLLGVKNIAFLPFNGVGNNSAKTKKILGELIRIKFHKRSILVDADKAGQDMFNQAKDANFHSVHSMSEITLCNGKKAMIVEDLFSTEDKKKFRAIGNKNCDGTSFMKDHCKISDFSKTTIDHFKQLFITLQDWKWSWLF